MHESTTDEVLVHFLQAKDRPVYVRAERVLPQRIARITAEKWRCHLPKPRPRPQQNVRDCLCKCEMRLGSWERRPMGHHAPEEIAFKENRHIDFRGIEATPHDERMHVLHSPAIYSRAAAHPAVRGGHGAHCKEIRIRDV